MIKISIKKDGQIIDSVLFKTMEEVNAWIFEKEKIQAFGKPAYCQAIEICVKEEEHTKIKVLVENATHDTYGNEVTPNIYKTEEGPIIPAIYEEKLITIREYDIIIEDVCEEIKQENINYESLKLLSDTDWMIIRELDCGIACPVEIKKARAEARSRVEK